MYVGRIVSVGRTKADKLVAMYRVSSRSFPNRQSQLQDNVVAVVPKKGFETDIYKNPYIAYNCLRIISEYAIVGNGTHVDPIAEKLESGMRMRDAVVSVLYGMDFEHDDLNTPRITAVIDKMNNHCTLGIVRHDALLVQDVVPQRGEALYLATYAHNSPNSEFRDGNFDASNAEEACDFILGKGVFSKLERPISAASAFESGNGFSLACRDINTIE